jgi:hypothetical protein
MWMDSQQALRLLTRANAEVYLVLSPLEPGYRRDDVKRRSLTFILMRWWHESVDCDVA